MNRREWALGATALALSGLSLPLRAQGGPVEGRDFQRLAQPIAMPEGKIEVVEFFGYWCPHCNVFEPTLDAWAKKLPPQVLFRRMPIAFNPAQEPAQRLYFALEALDLVETLHRKVFNWLHVERKRLNNDADVQAFAQASGADATKIVEAMKSFSVATKMRQARQLSEAYRIEGVPTLGIHGRWLTSPSIAGTPERALATADALIAQLRKS